MKQNERQKSKSNFSVLCHFGLWNVSLKCSTFRQQGKLVCKEHFFFFNDGLLHYARWAFIKKVNFLKIYFMNKLITSLKNEHTKKNLIDFMKKQVDLIKSDRFLVCFFFILMKKNPEIMYSQDAAVFHLFLQKLLTACWSHSTRTSTAATPCPCHKSCVQHLEGGGRYLRTVLCSQVP